MKEQNEKQEGPWWERGATWIAQLVICACVFGDPMGQRILGVNKGITGLAAFGGLLVLGFSGLLIASVHAVISGRFAAFSMVRERPVTRPEMPARVVASAFSAATLLLPKHISDEELGDAEEVIQARIAAGCTKWEIHWRVFSALLWAFLHAFLMLLRPRMSRSRAGHR